MSTGAFGLLFLLSFFTSFSHFLINGYFTEGKQMQSLSYWFSLAKARWDILALMVLGVLCSWLVYRTRFAKVKDKRALKAWDRLYKAESASNMVVPSLSAALEVITYLKTVRISQDYKLLPFVGKSVTYEEQSQALIDLKDETISVETKERIRMGMTFNAFLYGGTLHHYLFTLELELFSHIASHQHYAIATDVQFDQMVEHREDVSPLLRDMNWTYADFLGMTIAILPRWYKQAGANLLRMNHQGKYLVPELSFPTRSVEDQSMTALGECLITVYGLINGIRVPIGVQRYDHLTYVLYCHFTNQMINKPANTGNVIPLRRKDK